MRMLFVLLLLTNLPVVWAYEPDKCAAANAHAESTASAYQSEQTAYDYCQEYGDTSGTGYGSKDCSAAYSRAQTAKSNHDDAVSEQWQYCY